MNEIEINMEDDLSTCSYNRYGWVNGITLAKNYHNSLGFSFYFVEDNGTKRPTITFKLFKYALSFGCVWKEVKTMKATKKTIGRFMVFVMMPIPVESGYWEKEPECCICDADNNLEPVIIGLSSEQAHSVADFWNECEEGN